MSASTAFTALVAVPVFSWCFLHSTEHRILGDFDAGKVEEKYVL
jgi:hypothetical protein